MWKSKKRRALRRKEMRRKAAKRLQKIVGTSWAGMYRAADMPDFDFLGEKGISIALHCFSRVVVTKDDEIILDSDDIYVPAAGVQPNEDLIYDIGECKFDVDNAMLRQALPLTVESIRLKNHGVIRIELEQGFSCYVLPWLNDQSEVWRVFYWHPHRRFGRHLVYYGNGMARYE